MSVPSRIGLYENIVRFFYLVLSTRVHIFVSNAVKQQRHRRDSFVDADDELLETEGVKPFLHKAKPDSVHYWAFAIYVIMNRTEKRSKDKQRKKLEAQVKNKQSTEFKAIKIEDFASAPHWMTRAFANNKYIVMIDDNALTTKGFAIRAMVQSVGDTVIPNHWRVLQDIKNEVFGREVMAIEYYPKESRLIDDHNIYWLWIFPEGILPEIF